MAKYVAADRVKLDLDDGFKPTALGLDDLEYETLLESYIEEESNRAEQMADMEWSDPVPTTVKTAVIRLVRARFIERQTDGLESESTGDNASYNYSSPDQIRKEVAADLAEDEGTDDGLFWSIAVN